MCARTTATFWEEGGGEGGRKVRIHHGCDVVGVRPRRSPPSVLPPSSLENRRPRPLPLPAFRALPPPTHPSAPRLKSLAKALVKIFKCSLISTAVLALCQQFVLLAVPLVVQQLLGWLIDEDDDRTYVGVLWAVAL